MPRIDGTARLDTGDAATAVLVRDWATHAHVAHVTPDIDGAWEATVPAGTYDITTIGPAGYQPACEGPITVSA